MRPEMSTVAATVELDNLPPAAVLTFAEGLVGCPAWRRFVLLEDADDPGQVALLQCLDEPSVSFLVTDPRLIRPDYRAALGPEDRAALGLDGTVEPVLLCILHYRAETREVTANLLGPLVINPQTRRGRQVVLTEGGYSARFPVPLEPDDSGVSAAPARG